MRRLATYLLQLSMGAVLLLAALLFIGALFAGALERPPVLRPGKWVTEMAIVRFDVDGVAPEYRDSLRSELTAPWGFEGESRRREEECLSPAAADAFGRLGPRPEPPGWQQQDCAFTRRGNSRSSIDVAGECRKGPGLDAQSFTVTGTVSRQSTSMKLTFDQRIARPGLAANAHWEVVADSRYEGPCDKQP